MPHPDDWATGHRRAAPVVPCPVLVGRSSELDVLTSALAAARAGRGGVVFVVGEAGIGKSRLVHELADTAMSHGVPVLRGRAVAGSDALAFRPLIEALAPVTERVAADPQLAWWLPALGTIIPTPAPAAAIEVTTPVRGEAVVRVLAAVCPSGGMLVLEDLHWADPETVDVVEHLTDNLHRAPVLCVVTLRQENSRAHDLVGRVLSRRTSPVVQLGRLNSAQVAAMVYSCTGGRSPDDLERALSMADGVPFLVEETLASPGLPETFADGVRARLAEFSEVDRRVLLAAAAFGRHFDWRLLARAAGVEASDVVEALERGVAAQLLTVEEDGFRFRHALTSEAVFQSVIPPRREAIATAALDALDEAHGPLPPALREVAARVAERAGKEERAGRIHLELGEEALQQGALRTAVQTLQNAASLLPDGYEEERANELLVQALVLAGRIDDALVLGQALARRLPPGRAGAVHLSLAGAAATAGRWELAGDELAAAAVSGGEAQPEFEAELSLREAEVALGTNKTARAEERARAALEIATSEGFPELQCEALQLLGRCARHSSLGAAERWFRDALAVAEMHALPLWRLRAMHELGTIGLLERAEVEALVEAQRLADSLGAMATAAVLDIEIAAGYAAVDDLDGTGRHGEQAVRRGGELGLDLIVAWGWQHVAAVAALRHEEDRAGAARGAARSAAPGNRDIEGFLVGGQVLAALAHDELDSALDLSTKMTELLRGSDTAPPGHHRAAWPVLLAFFGRPEAASAVEEIEQSGVAVTSGGRSWLTLARAIVAGRTDGEQAAALALEADALSRYMPMWQSLGRRLAAEAAATGGWQVPETWLPQAEACLRGLGLAAAADSCRRLRSSAQGPVPTAWTRLGVTRREADVLTLLIEGLSNKEIAASLSLSVRTVEKHVEALLRKTATKTRTHLARVAAPT